MPGRPEPHHITAAAFRLHAEHGVDFTRAMREALGRILLIEGDDSPELLPLLEGFRRRQGGKSLLESSESSASRGIDPAHEFATVQLDLPDWLADRVRRMVRRLFSPSDVSEYEDAPHITVRYGLHADSSSDVSACVVDSPPVKVRLGETDYFAGDNHDVVYVSVEDAGDGELKALRDSIGEGCPHTETRKGYTPHVTLAYVTKGCGKDYAGMLDLDGMEVEFRAVTFCDRAGRRSIIPLWQADAILEGIGWGEDEDDGDVVMEGDEDFLEAKSDKKEGQKWTSGRFYYKREGGVTKRISKAEYEGGDKGSSSGQKAEPKAGGKKAAPAAATVPDEAKSAIQGYLSGGGKMTPNDHAKVADMVGKLSIQQMRALAADLGLTSKGRAKAELAKKMADEVLAKMGKGEPAAPGDDADTIDLNDYPNLDDEPAETDVIDLDDYEGLDSPAAKPLNQQTWREFNGWRELYRQAPPAQQMDMAKKAGIDAKTPKDVELALREVESDIRRRESVERDRAHAAAMAAGSADEPAKPQPQPSAPAVTSSDEPKQKPAPSKTAKNAEPERKVEPNPTAKKPATAKGSYEPLGYGPIDDAVAKAPDFASKVYAAYDAALHFADLQLAGETDSSATMASDHLRKMFSGASKADVHAAAAKVLGRKIKPSESPGKLIDTMADHAYRRVGSILRSELLHRDPAKKEQVKQRVAAARAKRS